MSGIYSRGGEDIEAEQLAREAVIEALPRRAAPHLRTLHFRALTTRHLRGQAEMGVRLDAKSVTTP